VIEGWEVSVKVILSALFLLATTLGCTAAGRILMTRLGPSQSSLFVFADGSGEQKLTEGYLDYNPVWSLDGQWIVFTSERNGSADLYRMRPDGGGLERLTDDPAYDDQAVFSPDGNRIAFVTTRADGRANLWILDLKTRQATPLTSGAGGDFRPAWSPDGQWIAFLVRPRKFNGVCQGTNGSTCTSLTSISSGLTAAD
jgi:Tol biopolymer transport system component